jgi:serine/threonine protein kinase
VVVEENLWAANKWHAGCRIVGSPLYIAPEVMLNAIDDPAQLFADVYSLGIVLYCMVCARTPPLSQEGQAFLHGHKDRVWNDTDDHAGSRLYRDTRFRKECQRFLSFDWLTETAHSRSQRDAVSLAISMLNPLPWKRPTIEQVLQHKWCLA